MEGRRNGATIEVRTDSTVTVECRTDGAKPAAEVRWYKNGKLLESKQSAIMIMAPTASLFILVDGVETRVSDGGGQPAKLISSTRLSFVARPNDHQAVFTCQVLHAALPANSALRANFTLAVLCKATVRICIITSYT